MMLIAAIVGNEPKALDRINDKMTTAPIACSQKPAKLFIKLVPRVLPQIIETMKKTIIKAPLCNITCIFFMEKRFMQILHV